MWVQQSRNWFLREGKLKLNTGMLHHNLMPMLEWHHETTFCHNRISPSGSCSTSVHHLFLLQLTMICIQLSLYTSWGLPRSRTRYGPICSTITGPTASLKLAIYLPAVIIHPFYRWGTEARESKWLKVKQEDCDGGRNPIGFPEFQSNVLTTKLSSPTPIFLFLVKIFLAIWLTITKPQAKYCNR